MKTPPWPKKVKVSRRKYLFAVSLDYVWFGSQNFSCRLRTDKIREKKNLGTSTTPKPFYSHLSTNRDGHQSSCHRKGKIVPGTPYNIWNHTKFEIARAIIWRARHAAFHACVKKQKFCQWPWQHVQPTKWVQISNHICAAIPCRITYFSPNEVETFYEIKWEANYRLVGRGPQIFGLITLPLVINYALLGWAKKLKSSKCWWGQCVLVIQAIFRICGNESQPGLQLVERLATPLHVTILREIYCRLYPYYLVPVRS